MTSASFLFNPSSSHDYLVGVGKADITGPVVEVNLMGYADPAQLGSGVRQRLYSRAFILGDTDSPRDRFVYLVLDTQSGDTAVRNGILEGLKHLGPEYQVYARQNVAVTGTHSHSGPGAWLNYLLPQITSRGFSHQSYQAIVDGALESIKQAHQSLSPGQLSFDSIDIEDANINRSPYAYLANPEQERNKYKHNVDKTLTLLKLRRNSDKKDIGVLTWFPVHGTSMLGNNTLITGDNKGVAAYLFEKHAAQLDSTADGFVAGFSQANVGDTSPNVNGAYCESGDEEGEQCDFKTSLCAGKNGPCHGRGPHWGLDDAGTASAWEIGRRQYLGARSLYESMTTMSTSTPIQGKVVRSLHTFVDMSNQTVVLRNGSLGHTCPAAMGYSFAAGTTDGPGAFDFKQNNPGDPNASPVWAVVRNSLHSPGPEQKACETEKPYLWTPNVVDIQLLRIGQLLIIVAPGEATTMAGRRWKAALQKHARNAWDEASNAPEPLVVLGGPANTYAHYIATEEEYGVQRYEGASTLFGQHTLAAYMNLTLERLPYLSGHSISQSPLLPPQHPALPLLENGPDPPIHTNSSLSFISPVVFDRPPLFKSFGDVTTDVSARYALSSSPTVKAVFVAANPRNNLRLGDTFASVERYSARGEWERVRGDGDWSLVFAWERTSTTVGTSQVTISWELGWEGRYRIKYFGDGKGIGGSITAFEGVSGEFELV
ncbi:neutral/alkaline nonlysosomal ceramidase-like protein [Aureobasidium namibiae CBS 147.97]|uniref:Neutral ceramidase n=1 Tax=Aureobasidium namibiae CBS 147.97 TaxID=1043004 RepID=A0A074X3H4_9PEZI|nr:neutral/alkaline nonlysosomal ceramidase-like protein [Aureobasidium namibiae CBS 147.97]KEQ76557.1 neutral/alkaline nonlysosomal ceramidase-like protein [Aureobasidium namibiae CBS 147.97]